MNNLKFSMYEFISPKDEDIPQIANYIITNHKFLLPKKLKGNLFLFNYLIELNDRDILSRTFDASVFNQVNIDNLINHMMSNNIFFSTYNLPDTILNNPEFWTKILMREDCSIFQVSDLFTRNIDVYNQIDKNLIARVLGQAYSYERYDFIHKDLELLKIIVENNYPVRLSAFDEETLKAFGYDKLIDYFDTYDIFDGIPSEILNNRELLTKLCDHINTNKIYRIVYYFEDTPLENKLYILSKYDIYISNEYTKPLAEYVINNNITDLSQNAISTIFPTLLEKKYQNIFETIGNNYIPIYGYNDTMKNTLVDLYFDGNYSGELNNEIENLVFSSPKSLDHIEKIGDYIIKNDLVLRNNWPCHNSIQLANYLLDRNYNKLLKTNFEPLVIEGIPTEKFADYIINNEIISLPPYKNTFNALPYLIDKKYSHLFEIDIYANAILGEQYTLNDQDKEKLVDLFFANNYTYYIGEDFQRIVFSSPKSLDHIDIIGDYIINTGVDSFDASWPCRSSIQLFNYLYEKKYGNLLILNFDTQVFNTIPIEKLQEYYREHPEVSIDSLNINLRLAIQNIDLANVDYKVVKHIVLYDSRIDADKDMHRYDDISTKVCALLKVKSAPQVVDQFLGEMIDVLKIMQMEYNDLITLFTNYQNDPSKYETEIINLFRKFLSKQKEAIAMDLYNHRMEYILENFTKQDLNELYKRIRIERRKLLYSYDMRTWLTAKDGNTVKMSVTGLIDSLGLNDICDSEYDLVYKIINGEDILGEPDAYKKVARQRILTRLNNGYHKHLIDIINNNLDYRTQIIAFIKGEYSYDELRMIIDAKDLKLLHEIRNLVMEANPTLDDNFNFSADIDVTSEDIKISREYDRQMQAINKLRKHLNRHMNELYPLDSIEVTEDIVNKFSKSSDLKACFDPSKIGNIEPIFEMFKIRNSYDNPRCMEVFDRLLVDTGVVYGLPYISIKLSNDIILVAKKMDYIVDFVPDKDINFDNLDMLIKKAKTLEFFAPYREAILGEDVIYNIVTNDSFLWDMTSLGKAQRVEDGTKYIALAGRNIKSTIPYTRVEEGGYVAERYHSNDPEILLAGIKTDACFRLYGNDNDFLLYTMFNKNGLVVKLSDSDGNFVGRMSGFRNGNTVYFNQLRTIYDVSGTPSKEINRDIQKIRECAIKYANDLIASTSDSNEPIEHVIITKSYGFAGYDDLPEIHKPSDTPMDTTSADFDEFKRDSELKLIDVGRSFTTDYKTNLPVLLMATTDIKKFRDEGVKSFSPQALYDRPRKKPITYNGRTTDIDILKAINEINAKSIYWGDTSKREERKKKFRLLTSISNIDYAVIGEDFYIIIDKEGKQTEICLPYDERALEEFNKYKEIVNETYNNSTQKR